QGGRAEALPAREEVAGAPPPGDERLVRAGWYLEGIDERRHVGGCSLVYNALPSDALRTFRALWPPSRRRSGRSALRRRYRSSAPTSPRRCAGRLRCRSWESSASACSTRSAPA